MMSGSRFSQADQCFVLVVDSSDFDAQTACRFTSKNDRLRIRKKAGACKSTIEVVSPKRAKAPICPARHPFRRNEYSGGIAAEQPKQTNEWTKAARG